MEEHLAIVPVRRRNSHVLHLILFFSTLYTVTLTGAFSEADRLDLDPSVLGGNLLIDPTFLALGLSYSLCLFAILGVHEMGHYLACRYYRVDASLPYFLPSVPFLIGTFGAFIRIRDPIPNRKVLFDVGVAGPLAGFAVTVPVLLYGVLNAEPVTIDTAGDLSVGVPLLIEWLLSWMAPPLQPGQSYYLSGPLMAGWVGCMATALNLLPIGQLDGGHISYAISGRFHRLFSMIFLVAFVALGLFVFPGWLFLATLLIMFGPQHPPLLDESPGLSRGRLLLAAVSLVILIVCFIAKPLSVQGP